MAKIQLLVGSTSNTVNVFIQDSSKTDGSGLASLVYNSSGLTAYYALPRAAPVAITLATQTVTGAFSSGGFVELDATHTKGLYRLDIPDAAVASGRFANIYLYGATNMAPVVLEIELTATNNQDAVRAGMTALPNAAAEASGGLYTRGTGAGQIKQTNNGEIDSNSTHVNNVATTSVTTVAAVLGTTIAPTFTGSLIKCDVTDWNATAVSAPATAGIPEVNIKNINNVAATSVTTINANIGTTQPVNYTGTGASAYVKVDLIDIAGAAVSTSTAQLGVNVVNFGATAVTGRDIGASVLLSSGTGTGQLDFTSGIVKANLAQILGTALTETSGQLAGGFKKFFNIAAPAATMDHLILVDTVTTATTASALTTNNDKTGYALTAAYDAAKTASQAGDIMKVSSGTGANQISLSSGLVSLTAGQLFIKKNAALANFEFVMTDSTTHAPKTGLTVAATRNIDNAGFGACANSVSEVGNGWYVLNLAAADLNGTVIALRFTSAGADDRNMTIITQA